MVHFVSGISPFWNLQVIETANMIGEGHFNRMRNEGNKVINNTELASIPQTINKGIDPLTIAENSGKDIDMVNSVHFYNNTKSAKLNADIFFNIKKQINEFI